MIDVAFWWSLGSAVFLVAYSGVLFYYSYKQSRVYDVLVRIEELLKREK